MVEPGADIQFLLSDFNTRLRDIDERNKLVRERVLLLGKNLLSSRQEMEDSIREIKRENQSIKMELEKLKKVSGNLVSDFNKFVKRDEMLLVERMLKDFQPLEFMRKKDVEALIEKRMDDYSKKQIKTSRTYH